MKLAVMQLLHKYGITEDDFTSAELEAVAVDACENRPGPVHHRAYGHDDRARLCGIEGPAGPGKDAGKDRGVRVGEEIRLTA